MWLGICIVMNAMFLGADIANSDPVFWSIFGVATNLAFKPIIYVKMLQAKEAELND